MSRIHVLPLLYPLLALIILTTIFTIHIFLSNTALIIHPASGEGFGIPWNTSEEVSVSKERDEVGLYKYQHPIGEDGGEEGKDGAQSHDEEKVNTFVNDALNDVQSTTPTQTKPHNHTIINNHTIIIPHHEVEHDNSNIIKLNQTTTKTVLKPQFEPKTTTTKSNLGSVDLVGSGDNGVKVSPPPPPTPPPKKPKKNKRHLFIYISSGSISQLQATKLIALYSIFNTSLYVAIDKLPPSHLESEAHAHITDIIPIKVENLITNEMMSEYKTWSHKCCSQEMTIHWLMRNKGSYDTAWILESDVHFEPVDIFSDFVHDLNRDDYSDLLHQNVGMEAKPIFDLHKLKVGKRWWYSELFDTSKVTQNALFKEPFYRGMYHFFRVSTKFIDELEKWYERNNRLWIFFEPLISTLAVQSPVLTTNVFPQHSKFPIYFRWRPCYQESEIKQLGGVGLFHPVKDEGEDCANVVRYKVTKSKKQRLRGEDKEIEMQTAVD